MRLHRRAYPWREPTHPLLQRRLPPPDSALALFRSPAAGALHALVADHVVQGRVIFPGAGYLELARAACDSVPSCDAINYKDNGATCFKNWAEVLLAVGDAGGHVQFWAGGDGVSPQVHRPHAAGVASHGGQAGLAGVAAPGETGVVAPGETAAGRGAVSFRRLV